MPTTERRHPARPAHTRYDVIVVGARVAGAATAHLLARMGLDVVVVDRGRYGMDTLSTHALMRGGVLQLARWGLLDRITAAGTPPVRRTTFRYAGETTVIPIKASRGVNALYAPRRTVLDPILVDAACDAGAEVCFGASVAGVTRDSTGRVRGVVGRAADGSALELVAPLVVGADGIRSRIAELAGAFPERVGVGASTVVYGHWAGLDTDGYEWNFHPGAASGVIPTNGDAASVFVAGTKASIGAGGLDALRCVLARSETQLADRLRAAHLVAPVRTFTGRPSYLRRSWGPGWALVGDAGYFKDPLSAHGITDSLRDAELLARAAAATLDGHCDGPLADYQARRDALSGDLFTVTDAIARHNWTDEQIGALLLKLNAAMSAELEELAELPDMALHGAGSSR